MNNRFSVLRADHVGFAVPSLEHALAFWVDGLGGRLLRRAQMDGAFPAEVTGTPDTASVQTALVDVAGQTIELLQYTGVSALSQPTRAYQAGCI
jgi:glyoxylase I family protein